MINKDMLAALIHISNILVEEYNLSVDEAAECVTSYRDYSIFTSMESLEIFLHTDYRTMAKRMYDKYILIHTVPLVGKGSVCGEEPWDSNASWIKNNQDKSDSETKGPTLILD